MIESILKTYAISDIVSAEPIASGLINRTWKITCEHEQYILQRINDHVFKKPSQLAENIKMIDEYLAEHSPGYLFAAPLINSNKDGIVHVRDEGYFRLFPFVKGSHTISVVETPQQAFQAALQFGKFTQLLAGFDSSRLYITIPDFHNLTLRYRQFEDAIATGNRARIAQSAPYINEIRKRTNILDSFERIQKSREVKKRVTHHDTKISNVLFDDNGMGICVIDLDTVMPGYFISDVGDMMRTYLSPASEEEKDFTKIDVREDFFRAIVQGYLSNMKDELTEEERGLILYAGLFLIYMQAIRFLADYCNNDSYYGANYEEHNFVRAGNQLALLKRLEEKSSKLDEIISAELKVYS
ncbi:MAG TPA: aminoglycoside phosphotransferase family protein [Chryseolinea sp.]